MQIATRARRPRVLHIGHPYPFVTFAINSLNAHLDADTVAYLSPPGNRSASLEQLAPNIVTTWPVSRLRRDATVRHLARHADVIIAHELTGISSRALLANPRAISLWSGWGTDYYGDAMKPDRLHGPITLKLLPRPSSSSRLRRYALHRIRSHATRHVDLISAPISADERVMRAAFPGMGGRYIDMPYMDVPAVEDCADAPNDGPDILVGNSATPTCNHLEAFEILQNHDLRGRRIIVPLTYGDAQYRLLVERAGRRILGQHFYPLTDHLPLASYESILNNCGIAIFNHRRQQAMGNIISLLRRGTVLYLDSMNPTFPWLRANGATVFATSDLEQNPLRSTLSLNQATQNRGAVQAIWGEEAVAGKYKHLADVITALFAGEDRYPASPATSWRG